jgi:pimeloyl-ACP methyl ester carboxylesterase
LMPGSGHYPYIEAAERFGETVAAFLAEL